MKFRNLWIPAFLLTLLAFTTIAAKPAAQTFSGEYDWVNGGKGALTAEFKPDGTDQWKVTFKFDFDGDKNTWQGTASGSLEESTSVTGTAQWKNRTWSFDADIEDGVMRGTHTEMKSRGRTVESGTFEIAR